MICLNCGRPNPSGTSLCNRCRERRPGLERARGGVIYQRTRETARVTKRGPGILAVGVLLLAGLIFAGGTLAVFFAPRDPGPTNPAIANPPGATASRLDIFEQGTPTPAPTPTATPWFPSTSPTLDLLSPTLSLGVTFAPPTDPFATPKPTRTPRPATPTPPPDPQPLAKFNGSQQGNTKTAVFNSGNSVGAVSFLWDFGGEGSSTDPNPEFSFADYGGKSVTLTVTDADGDQDSITKTIQLARPDCDETGNPPDCNPTPEPTLPPTPGPIVSPAPVAVSFASRPS